jgi:hypothetical protein
VGRRARLAAALAMAATLVLSGCQQVREALAGPTDAELLAAVSLTENDVAQGAYLEPYPGGERVGGQTSLDLCFGEFPSEELRVGRHQVGVSDAAGEAWVSSEAILYSVPEEAAQAMAELERARAGCPETPVEPTQPDREPLQWAFSDPPDADWPQEQGVLRQAYAFTVTGPTSLERAGTATYLQRGRMILALYATPGNAPASTIRRSPDDARFTQVMARRLAALPWDSLQEPNPMVPTRDPDGISA